MPTEFTTKNHGTGKIDVTDLQPAMEFRPSQLHMKEDGAKDNTPSFLIVMEHDLISYKIYGQVSLKMLNKALGELGYKITPDESILG